MLVKRVYGLQWVRELATAESNYRLSGSTQLAELYGDLATGETQVSVEANLTVLLARAQRVRRA
jgi:hypothetical protein